MCVNISVHNHRKRLSGYDALLSIQHLTLFEDTTVEKKITSGILMLRSIFIFYSLNGINFIWFQFNLHSSEHKSVFCLLHSSVFRFTVERKHHKNHKRQLHNHICSSPVFRDNLNKNLPIHCQHMKWLKSILCIFFLQKWISCAYAIFILIYFTINLENHYITMIILHNDNALLCKTILENTVISQCWMHTLVWYLRL